MKRNILLLTILLAVLSVSAANDTLVQQAETLYAESKYRETAGIYENMLSQNKESQELYYNLGNAYYKLGENTKAILNYERALRINPSHKDARYNLQMAQRRIVDKIEVLPELFLIRWYKLLVAQFSADQWALFSIVLFCLFLVTLTFFLYSSVNWIKKIGFSSSFLILFLTVMTIVFTIKQYNKIEVRDSAVVMAPSVTVKGAPDDSGTALFVIHEGLKVTVKGQLKDWYNIRLQDGNEGWVSVGEIEII